MRSAQISERLSFPGPLAGGLPRRGALGVPWAHQHQHQHQPQHQHQHQVSSQHQLGGALGILGNDGSGGNDTLLYFVAARLLTEYAGNAEIRAIVDKYQIYFLATGNPDGLAHVWSTNANWRKNRRPNPDGSFGVDMNRNYPFGWDIESCRGSDSYTSSGYRGPSAASEPEVQTGIALQNDRNFDRVFDFHTGCGPDVRYNYAAAGMLPHEIDEYVEIR
eukprot:gene16852-biopygen350